MPPRRTRKKSSSSAPRRSKKGGNKSIVIILLLIAIGLAGFSFHLLQQERERNQSVAEKARSIEQENPGAEVFGDVVNPDVDQKKK